MPMRRHGARLAHARAAGARVESDTANRAAGDGRPVMADASLKAREAVAGRLESSVSAARMAELVSAGRGAME